MQGEVGCSCNDGTGQHSLELRPGFKPLHVRRASVHKQQVIHSPAQSGSDCQAFAAFGAPGSNHCTATAGLHAGQETVGSGAFDFGGLVCAFHGKSCWPYRACYWAVSCEASIDDSNDLGRACKTAAKLPGFAGPLRDCCISASAFRENPSAKLTGSTSPLRIGKPVIITDFPPLTTKSKARPWLAGKFCTLTSARQVDDPTRALRVALVFIFNFLIQISSSSKGRRCLWTRWIFRFQSSTCCLSKPVVLGPANRPPQVNNFHNCTTPVDKCGVVKKLSPGFQRLLDWSAR